MAAQEIGSLYLGLGFDTAVFDRQIVQIPQKVTQATQAITKGFSGASKEIDNFQKSTGATRAGLQNLSFQLNDIGTSLASGSSPFRVLAQQGGQIVQVFQQAGFRNIATAIVGMVTPMRALAVGAVAAGAAFGGLLLRAQSNSEQLRQFNLLLERTGRLSSNLDVGGENSRLRALGINRDTAQAQRLAIARNPQLNPAASERLQTLGANLGAYFGIGPEAGSQLLMQQISGGAEATIRFAASTQALTTAQAAALISSARLTGGLTEQNQAIAALDKQMKGLAKEAMDPMSDATNKLAGAWDNLLTSLSKTTFVQNIRNLLIEQAQGLADFAEGKTTVLGPRNLPDTPQRSIFGGGFGPGGNRVDIPGGANFPTLANPNAPPPQFTTQPAAVPFDPTNPFATPLTFSGQIRAWRSPNEMAATSRFGGAAAGGGAVVVARDPQQAITVADSIDKQRKANAAAIPIQRLWNVEQEAAAAAQARRIELQAQGATPAEQETGAALAAAAARARYNIELGKENTLTGMRIEGERKAALAMLDSASAAAKVTAAEQARIDTLQRGGDVAKRTQQALDARSAAAETSLAQGVAQGRNQTEEAQLRVSLLGQSTEYIERQIALLRVRQQVEAAGVPVAKEVVDARLAGVNALQDELDLLARQRRVMDTFREIAGVFENAFGRAFDSIADGTFKVRAFLGDLLKDLGKTLASSAFRRLLGGDSGEGGILGSLVGRLFPSLLGGGSSLGIGADYGGIAGGNPFAAFAGGGSFAVGGSGSIDSQLVAFRASPGEMVDVRPQNRASGGGYGEIIRIDLNPSEGWVAGVADQRIVTRSGQIIEVAVRQSSRTVQRNFAGMSAEAQSRQL
jgi:hypothetical protein